MQTFRTLIILLGVLKAHAASSTTTAATSLITGCHTHGSDIYCYNENGSEVLVSATATTSGIQAQYTGCHTHGNESYCMDDEGNDVLVEEEETNSEEEHGDEHNHSDEESEENKTNCHFHAGVEHCTSEDESEENSGASCGIQTRDYDVPLRIGTLFVILVTSAIGVFAPILLAQLRFASINAIVSIILKQFGTGVIIATAFVHLYTHASLMFTNECLGELDYEATTSAVVMAGIFLAFLSEYAGHRFMAARARIAPSSTVETPETQLSSHKASPPSTQPSNLVHLGHSHGLPLDPTKPNSKFSVLVMEAGVLFHSILIGLTLVVAGDSFYKTLLVVIVFHQFFEGLALGARIAMLPDAILPSKALMAGAFALITPIGMAIGLGVLHSFNGNERSTLIALGTLDALSAGILVWVGVVDMWARDWAIEGGEMLDASLGKVLMGGWRWLLGWS
ncbi:hypothetical protein N7462_008845 [Penicillium macrosclerotiorum]|uniref:uncharacterized protein n=1 Tax=Penicillium macrosclerotiorum TaxID=303699 RepID=UPI002548074C|nr:uncharacterized protein N7462_008845 [Penicillium macrosclerotiorum]KAJ5675948.1 hypothetical protein N7462_008845 [Penicillium macrosclerotiorum]